MRTFVAVALLILGTSTVLMATNAVPEIDPTTASSAVALLAGVGLVLRGHRKK